MCLVVVSKLLMRFDNCMYHPRKFLRDSFQPIPTCHPRRQLISDFCQHKLFLSVLLIQVSRIIPYLLLYLFFFHSTCRFLRFILSAMPLYQRYIPFCYWAVYPCMKVPIHLSILLFFFSFHFIVSLCKWKTRGYKYSIFGSNPSSVQSQEPQVFVMGPWHQPGLLDIYLCFL